MPFVSITRLRVRSWRYLPGFFWYATLSSKQARSAGGHLSLTTLKDAGLTFWTRTLWTSEAAMRAFMVSGAHGKVMRHLLEWCDEAALVHWMQESGEPPSWEEAHRRLLESGRTSKVHHPSEDQRAFHIPAPFVKITSEARLK